MNRWTYYSPLMLGTLVPLTLHGTIAEAGPPLTPATYWPFVGAVCLGIGLLCQLFLIGAQGAFAQVLPVPGGRSIRGRGAVSAGWLVMVGVVLTVGGAMLRSEEAALVSAVTAGIGLAALLAAAVAYIWCWPAAVRDFAPARGE